MGPLFGVFDAYNLQGEVGVDYFATRHDPFYFNGKIGMKENLFGPYAPSWSLGIFNCGTSRRTNQNIANFVLGKTVPYIGGQLYLGLFSGSKAMQGDRQGFMAGYKREFMPVKSREGKEYNRWAFLADYASGKNTIGGGSIGVMYSFAPTINILTGPIWFNSRALNGRWKWTVQLNIGL